MWNTLTYVMTSLSFLLGVATAIQSFRAWRFNQMRKKVDWNDLKIAAKKFRKGMKKKGFVPDFMITPSLRGATFANLFDHEINPDHPTPVYVGITLPHNKGNKERIGDGFRSFSTEKWDIFLPDYIFRDKDSKVLIVDDFLQSGDSLQNMTRLLMEAGIKKENILSAVVIVSAMAGAKKPDMFWREAEKPDFLFPWGEAK